jgi:hypothetical protein
VASASRPARVRRVASSIMFEFSMSFMSKASFCSETINRPHEGPNLSPLGMSSGSNAASEPRSARKHAFWQSFADGTRPDGKQVFRRLISRPSLFLSCQSGPTTPSSNTRSFLTMAANI